MPYVDDVEQHPIAREQEQRAQSIDEPEEALHAGQRLRVVVRARRPRRPRPGRILVGAEQQHARRDRPVLVAAEGGDAKDLDRRRDAVGARLPLADLVRRVVEEGADVTVFDRAAEQLAAVDHHPRIQNRAIPRRQHGADGLGEPRLLLRERPPLGHTQDVARPEPPDDERARIVRGLDRQPSVRRRGQDGLGLERGAREELLQRVLQERVVQRADRKRRR